MAVPPLVTLSDIQLGFGAEMVLSGASLSIEPGARIGLVGRNGSGKSTLLKVLAGLAEPDAGSRFVRPGTTVAYMEQDPVIDTPTLGDWVAEGLEAADRHRAEIAMEGVGVDPDAAPSTASGGERRRAALARLIAAEPDLMLLDEPTNHLDIDVIGWLEQHLAQTSTGFVVISHDRAFLRAVTTATLWVDRGTVRRLERGFSAFEDWRDKLLEEEEIARHKQARLIQAEARWAVEGISARRKRNQGRVRRLQALRADRAAHIKQAGTARLALDSGPQSGRLVAEVEGISKRFGDRRIVRSLSLRIQRGDRVALVGPNGVGKTTVLKMLLGEVTPDEGRIRRGTNLVPAVFDQSRAALDPDATLWETLTGNAALGVSGRNDQVMVRGQARHVVGYLKDFLFSETQARGPVRSLSGGEKARLLLSVLMARESNLLVLDEPTNDLDLETLDLLQEVLSDYDGTVLLVSHDRDFVDRVATTTLGFEGDGRVTVYAGGYTDMLAQRREVTSQPAARKPSASKKPAEREKAPEAPTGLSFTQAHRLEALPSEIARLESDVAKLTELLATPGLFETSPEKAKKATEALADRQSKLDAAEEEWLELEELRTEAGA